MELDQYPEHIENLMRFIRNKEVLKFKLYLRDNALELKTFVDSAFVDKCTLLMCASYHGQKEIVQALLDIGCDVNLQNDALMPALMFAAYSGHDVVVKMLLEKHAHVNTIDSVGSTALHMAAHMGQTDAVRVLLEEGVDINIRNNAGWTAKQIAEYKGFPEIARALANVEELDRYER